MEFQEIRHQLLLIIFDLTTPLVSLNGFCDLLLQDSNSSIILEQITIIKNSVKIIQDEKLQLLELVRTANTLILGSAENAARYLHGFAANLTPHEENISKAVYQIINFDPNARTERLDSHIHHISSHHKRLNALIQSIKTIKPDLELNISNQGKTA